MAAEACVGHDRLDITVEAHLCIERGCEEQKQKCVDSDEHGDDFADGRISVTPDLGVTGEDCA